jgi:hypothetical protein
MFEQICYNCLHSLTEFSRSTLNLKTPWAIELGLTGVTALNIAVEINPFERFWGPMRRAEVVHRRILNDLNSETIDMLLLEFFSTVYDAARPQAARGLLRIPPGPTGLEAIGQIRRSELQKHSSSSTPGWRQESRPKGTNQLCSLSLFRRSHWLRGIARWRDDAASFAAISTIRPIENASADQRADDVTFMVY